MPSLDSGHDRISAQQEKDEGVQGGGSLLRAGLLLKAIAAQGRSGILLGELARQTRLPRPTAYRVAQMLEGMGWVERDPSTKRLHLGRELAILGLSAQIRHPIGDVARPLLARLAREIDQTVYLIVRSGLESVCVARCESDTPIRTLILEVGSRQPLGVGAGSMAILAMLPADEMERIIAVNRERYMEQGGFQESVFRASLAEARQSAVATHEGSFTRGVSGIGVAVRDASGYPVAAVSIAFVTEWLDGAQRERCIRRLQAVAEELADLLTGAPGSGLAL
jgi:DNA-binding IclR family transcriptional regulator